LKFGSQFFVLILVFGLRKLLIYSFSCLLKFIVRLKIKCIRKERYGEIRSQD
jgi:hypothetical protein